MPARRGRLTRPPSCRPALLPPRTPPRRWSSTCWSTGTSRRAPQRGPHCARPRLLPGALCPHWRRGVPPPAGAPVWLLGATARHSRRCDHEGSATRGCGAHAASRSAALFMHLYIAAQCLPLRSRTPPAPRRLRRSARLQRRRGPHCTQQHRRSGRSPHAVTGRGAARWQSCQHRPNLQGPRAGAARNAPPPGAPPLAYARSLALLRGQRRRAFCPRCLKPIACPPRAPPPPQTRPAQPPVWWTMRFFACGASRVC